MCAEIISISSSESNGEWIDAWENYLPESSVKTPFHAKALSESSSETWSNYFPEGWESSGLTKEAARKKKMDPFHAKVPTAKEEFLARAKVLGLPNATFCADHGIKPWSPKIAKECSKGKGKKPIG